MPGGTGRFTDLPVERYITMVEGQGKAGRSANGPET
jgi:hypothetical protein